MRRLSHALLAAFAALSLAVSMTAVAVAVCPDGRMTHVTTGAAHDCDSPAPTAPGPDDHQPCRMLAPCVSIAFGGTSVAHATIASPPHLLPAGRMVTPPARIARAPAPPPPRA
jgi:hypothetical protein